MTLAHMQSKEEYKPSAAQIPAASAPVSAEAALRSVHASNLPALLDRLHIGLLVSTNQAGKVILIRHAQGTLNTYLRAFAKPMGIAADAARLAIGGTSTAWYYRNMPALAQKLGPGGMHDARYLPQRIHVTDDIDIHELAWGGDGELWLFNTRFCCL